MTGEEFIHKICEKLEEEEILLYDSNIVRKLASLTGTELSELINTGDVISWKNERHERTGRKTLENH